MIRDHEKADAALADARWWLSGFEAAAVSGVDEVAHRLWRGLQDVRQWIVDLSTGERRILGLNDRQRAVVLTEAEFECLVDAIKVPEERERQRAEALIEQVFREMQAELSELNQTDLPF